MVSICAQNADIHRTGTGILDLCSASEYLYNRMINKKPYLPEKMHKMKKSSTANAKKTGWELQGLKGKVKEHAMTVYDIKNKTVKEIAVKAVFKYNKKGNRTECTYFDADGVLMKKYIARYDGRCNQTEGAWYNADGSLFRKDVFKYDGYDNQIERANYNADGVLLNRTIYKFDANGKQTEGILCNIDGSLKVKGVYKYDAAGKLLEIEHYNADGSANSKINLYPLYNPLSSFFLPIS